MIVFATGPDELRIIVTMLVGVLLLLSMAIIWLSNKVEDGCPECPHCQRRARERTGGDGDMRP